MLDKIQIVLELQPLSLTAAWSVKGRLNRTKNSAFHRYDVDPSACKGNGPEKIAARSERWISDAGKRDIYGESSLYLSRFFQCVLAATIGLAVVPVRALSLADAVVLARQTDPIYLSARANLSASRERSDQAVANLLPQVSVTANTNANRRSYDTRDSPLPVAKDKYNSKSAQLSVTQPLWRSANRIAVTQADAAVAQADFQVVAAEQDLLVRLVQAWFDVMWARDTTMFTEKQVAATKFQWEQTRHGAGLGLATITAVEEARMRHDQAAAEQAVADADQDIKLAALEQIIGPMSGLSPPLLSDGFNEADSRSGTLEDWLGRAEAASPAVLAASRALDAATEEIRKQRAGHEPTLDMVATYGRNGQGAGSFPGQNGYDINQRAIGLQLNIPLYSGGGQSAKVREAVALREKAAQDLESARRSARLAGKQAWFGWQAGNARKVAAMQALKYSAVALKAATTGRLNDVKTELDVLEARQHMYSSLRDVQKARYEIIVNHLKLKAVAGQLVDADLVALDEWFVNYENRAVGSSWSQHKNEPRAQ